MASVETPYLISTNFEILFDLLIILVVPLVLNLKVKQKLIWVLCNYVFASFYLMSFNKILSISSDTRTILKKVEYSTPKDEYQEILFNYNKSDVYLVNDTIYLWPKEKNGRFDIQYCTLFTSDYITEIVNKRLNKISSISHIVFLNPSVLNSGNPFKLYNEIYNQYKKDSTSLKFPFKPLSSAEMNKIDSLRHSFNEIFYFDIKLMDSLKNNAKFNSNRKYADYVYNYLNQYENVAKDSTNIKNLIDSGRIMHILEFENSSGLLTYYLD